MGKWLRKYERFPQADYSPTTASGLSFKTCDSVPYLDSIVKYLGLMSNEHFSSLVLYSEFHKEKRSMDVELEKKVITQPCEYHRLSNICPAVTI
ncbi:hypothetical protein NE237_000120 [Protea cynaroides]|uniref:Uncharacterized protein n=1 Tax=Protea cynaroides TaxID=273540 RepID=A0A9Q0GNK1_9MAGN|nr:hypothetical protein NE237_000120 [Protea cynaroides]